MTTHDDTQNENNEHVSFISRLRSKPSNIIKRLHISRFLNRLPVSGGWLVVAFVVGVIVVGSVLLFRGGRDTEALDQAFVAEGPKLTLNKSFNVPIRNNKGDTVGNDLVVNVTTMERVDKILYKGRPLTARNGKDFLVLNLEVENSTNNRLTVRPVDFFRLVDSSGKSYAPDIQTDPVRVEAFSSKRTRTIYIVDEGAKNLKFLIGEIKGDNKETVEVSI